MPLLYDLLRKLLKREFGSDLLGGISIITSVLLGEYLAGSIIVLMLAGGEALESYALRSASSVLAALAKRMPSVAHRKRDAEIVDVALQDVAVGDTLVIYPHDICPVDGVVIDGHGVMDESYLTGEPFQITKTRGSTVHLGRDQRRVGPDDPHAPSAPPIRATRRSWTSCASPKPAGRQLRRLGDRLGAIYTPVALTVAVLAWAMSGDAVRFLAVLVIATPCPLLIAIPIAIIGSISLCARRAIIVKSPVVLEQIAECRTAIFDKTGTLTYGEPKLTEQLIAPGFAPAGRADARGESGALLETSAGARHSGGGDEGRDSDSGSHRGERTARPGTARNGFGPSGAGHQPEQADGARHCLAPISFRRSPVDSNAWWRSTSATRRPCAFVMRLARRVAPS